MGANVSNVSLVFFGVWIALGIFSAAFFLLNNDAALKRKVFAPLVIGVGVLFLGVAALTGMPLDAFFYFVFVPAVALITFLNLRSTRFCDSCGKTVISHIPLARPKFCSRCGSMLDDSFRG